MITVNFVNPTTHILSAAVPESMLISHLVIFFTEKHVLAFNKKQT